MTDDAPELFVGSLEEAGRGSAQGLQGSGSTHLRAGIRRGLGQGLHGEGSAYGQMSASRSVSPVHQMSFPPAPYNSCYHWNPNLPHQRTGSSFSGERLARDRYQHAGRISPQGDRAIRSELPGEATSRSGEVRGIGEQTRRNQTAVQ